MFCSFWGRIFCVYRALIYFFHRCNIQLLHVYPYTKCSIQYSCIKSYSTANSYTINRPGDVNWNIFPRSTNLFIKRDQHMYVELKSTTYCILILWHSLESRIHQRVQVHALGFVIWTQCYQHHPGERLTYFFNYASSFLHTKCNNRKKCWSRQNPALKFTMWTTDAIKRKEELEE